MMLPRIIPCLLLRNSGFVKTVKFKNAKYLGDPINIVKIFNDKEVDELVVLDITATIEGKDPNFKLLEELASEAFMPVAYGGGVRTINHIQTLLGLGLEKVVINSYAVKNPNFVNEATELVGSQSIVVSIDVKKTLWGRFEVLTRSGTKTTGLNPFDFAKEIQSRGAGELLLNSIDRDGTMKGFDLNLINQVADAVNIPLVACGGAQSVQDLVSAVKQGGASAAAAGSMFVFHGPHRAVLISYPSYSKMKQKFLES